MQFQSFQLAHLSVDIVHSVHQFQIHVETASNEISNAREFIYSRFFFLNQKHHLDLLTILFLWTVF